MNRRLAIGSGCAAVLLGLSAFLAFYERTVPAPITASTPPLEDPVPVSEPARAIMPEPAKPITVAPSPPPSAPPAPGTPALDEASLMARLRELRGSNPELTLSLAREAQQRFKNSPDAAEQAWFVVKSLTDLGRHDEARVEGRKLVKDNPGTRWAEDTHRHLFVNPATDPAERGFGKDRELD